MKKGLKEMINDLNSISGARVIHFDKKNNTFEIAMQIPSGRVEELIFKVNPDVNSATLIINRENPPFTPDCYLKVSSKLIEYGFCLRDKKPEGAEYDERLEVDFRPLYIIHLG